MPVWTEKNIHLHELRLLPDFVVRIAFQRTGWVLYCKKLNIHYVLLKSGSAAEAQAEAMQIVTTIVNKLHTAIHATENL